MKSLLSKQDRRQLDFLEILMQYNSIPLSQIERMIDYPIRTLSSDIRQINTYITPAKVVSSSAGIHLEIPPQVSVRHIYSRILHRSREYNLLVYIFFHEGQTHEAIAQELYLSISTLRRIVAVLNRTLKEQGITISTAPYRIEGDEKKITLLFTGILSELYLRLENLMSPEEQTLLSTLIKRLAKEFRLELHYPDLLRICTWMYVRIVRIRNGHYTNFIKTEAVCLDTCITDDRICAEFRRVFGLELNNRLNYEFFYMFLRFGYARSFEDVECIAAISPSHNILYKKLQILLEGIGQELSISLDDTRPLLLALFNALQFSDIPTSILYSHNSAFARGFTNDNAFPAAVLRRHIEIAFGSHNDTLDEFILYHLVTHWPGLIRKIKNGMPELMLGVLFDSDIEHAQFFADLTERISHLKLHVIVPDPERPDTLESDCREFDLLITNIPNLQLKYCEVICIQDYPTLVDKERIVAATERIHRRRHIEQNG